MTAFTDRIAFVHIPKTGGTSCRRYIKDHVPDATMLEDLYGSSPHLALRDFEEWIGRTPDSFEQIFAVVRDPYAHQVSQWLFWKDMYARGFRMPQHQYAALSPDLTHWLLQPMSDWHVRDPRPRGGHERTVTESPLGYLEFGGYYPYWLAVDGEVPDNVTLVRFEDLDRAWPAIMEPYAGGRFEMPHDNASGFTPDPSDYYSIFAMEAVEEKFKWAFQHGLYPKMKREGIG